MVSWVGAENKKQGLFTATDSLVHTRITNLIRILASSNLRKNELNIPVCYEA